MKGADFKWCNNCARRNCPHPDHIKIDGGCLFFEFLDKNNLVLMLGIRTGEAQIPEMFRR